jgi:hypothetical protein
MAVAVITSPLRSKPVNERNGLISPVDLGPQLTDNEPTFQGGLMRRSAGPRKTANLSDSVQQRLNMYGLVAGVAGVGMLVVAQPAAAKIVYTPANIRLGGIYPIDLNHDGIVDFDLYGTASTNGTCTGQWLSVRPRHGQNAIVGYSDFASALRPGARVGKARKFSPQFEHMAAESVCTFRTSQVFRGPWANGGKGVTNRYLGLKFFVKGKIHFGWARLNVNVRILHSLGTLTGYAYETIPGKSIIAGQTKGPDDDAQPIAAMSPVPKPATLGMLALGAPGLSIWRREDPVAATSDTN